MLLLAATDLKVRLLGFSQNWFNSAVSFVLSIEGSLTVRDALHLCRINVQGSGLVLRTSAELQLHSHPDIL